MPQFLRRVRRERRGRALSLTSESDLDRAARALARGAIVGTGFANIYVIAARPSAATVRAVNLFKGRPPEQVGSVMTTREHVASLFDWSRLPPELSRPGVLRLIDVLLELGPFGFRGPAAARMAAHLTLLDGDVRTTQVVMPGYACPSNRFFARAIELLDVPYLYGTSANRSRHATGAEDEPVHYTAAGLAAEFGHAPGFLTLRHEDELMARQAYPLHAPISTTILSFHRVAGVRADGKPRLLVERHGSLEVGVLAPILEDLGYALRLASGAVQRLAQRRYPPEQTLGGAA